MLACRTTPESDMEVFVPEESRLGDLEILSEEIKAKRLTGLYTPVEQIEEEHYKTTSRIFKYNPLSTKIFLQIPRPTMDNNTADADRLLMEIKKYRKETGVMQMGLSNIKKLPRLLRDSVWEVTVTLGNRNNTTAVKRRLIR